MAFIGEYNEDLKLYLAEYRSRTIASKQSEIDIPVVGARSKGELEPGKMYSFEYYTKDETFYDTKPLVLGLGESDNEHQLGINLHYMPYEARVPFMKEIVKNFMRFPDFKNAVEIDTLNQAPITTFKWEFLKRALGKKYNLTYCTRQYIMSKMKNPIVIGYEDYYMGTVNNEDNFYGGNINQAQSLYYKNI